MHYDMLTHFTCSYISSALTSMFSHIAGARATSDAEAEVTLKCQAEEVFRDTQASNGALKWR